MVLPNWLGTRIAGKVARGECDWWDTAAILLVMFMMIYIVSGVFSILWEVSF
jgi:hypothetical protein